ncbi:peptidoglycan-associated lipoprotein Pal [Parvularcula flava]|nr:peptidoglycan-associated lipoprotein Pal [Aquisalinus luteolus]NHK29305.1 peptidoglycan-associated lipoprotein Pal [Aquisalinus luteolus]
MPIKKFLLNTGIVVALAAVAACSSTPEETEVVDNTPTREVVTPRTPVETSSIVPGSQEDLEENVGHRVFFGYDEYNLTSEAQAQLSRQAAWLKQYPEARVRIAGNCDERGTREYNLALGARRANAAKAYLTSLGIDASRITTISYGKERPIASGSNPQAWAQNRNASTMLVTTGA